MKPRTDKWLQKQFDLINEKYYNNRIDSVRAVFGPTAKDADAHFDPPTRHIVINRDLRTHDCLTMICVLHESTHALMYQEGYIGNPMKSDDPDHGTRQQAEIDRLYKMGAYDGLL